MLLTWLQPSPTKSFSGYTTWGPNKVFLESHHMGIWGVGTWEPNKLFWEAAMWECGDILLPPHSIPTSVLPRPLASTVNDKLELQECLEHGRIAKVSPWGSQGLCHISWGLVPGCALGDGTALGCRTQ